MSAVLFGSAAAAAAYVVATRRPAARRLRAVTRTPAPGTSRAEHRRALLVTAAVAAALAAGPAVAVVAGVGVGAVLLAGRSQRRARDTAATRAGVVAVAEALAAELASGRPPGHALVLAAAEAGPLAGDLADLGAAVALGADPVPTFRRLAARPGADGLRAVAACWVVGTTSGAALGAALAQVVDLLDAEERVRRDVEVALAGPKVTARVLAALPAVGLLLGAGLGAHPLAVLVGTPLGRTLAVTAAVLEAGGWWWLRTLVRRAVPP